MALRYVQRGVLLCVQFKKGVIFRYGERPILLLALSSGIADAKCILYIYMNHHYVKRVFLLSAS